MTHTAGLSYGFDDNPVDALYRKHRILRLDETLEDKITRLVELPLQYQPNTVWHYSVATDVVGYLVQLMAGMPFETFLQERIFAPLGMVDTAFYVPPEKLDRLAAVYSSVKNGGLIRLGTEATKEALSDDHISKDVEPKFSSGGGGLVSTTEDYLHFAEMLRQRGAYNGVRLLGSRTLDYMTMNHLTPRMSPVNDPTMGFGLGFGVIVDPPQSRILNSPGNYGWGGAANTHSGLIRRRIWWLY